MQLREHDCAAVARLARRSGHPQLASRHGMELCVASWSRGILTISCKGSRRPTAGSAESSGADVIRRAQPARRRRRHSILDSGRAVTAWVPAARILIVVILSILFTAGCRSSGKASDGAAEDVRRAVQAMGAVVRHREMLGHLPSDDPAEVARLLISARLELKESANDFREAAAAAMPYETHLLAIRLLDEESEAWSHMELEVLTDRAEYGELADIFFAQVDAGWSVWLDEVRGFAESERVQFDVGGLDLLRRKPVANGDDPASPAAIVIPPPATPTNTPIPRPITPSRPLVPARVEARKVASVEQGSVEAVQRTPAPATALGEISPGSASRSVTAAPPRELTDLETPARITVATPLRPEATASPRLVSTAPSGATIVPDTNIEISTVRPTASAVTELPATPRNYQDAVEWKQDSTVVRFRDWLGAPALVSHWIVAVTPESVTVLEYPLAVDDALQLDIIVTSDGDLDGLSRFSFFPQPGL